MSKEQLRQRLTNLSFTEKIRIMERLRDRSLAFAAVGLRASEKPESLLLNRKRGRSDAQPRSGEIRKAPGVSPGNGEQES